MPAPLAGLAVRVGASFAQTPTGRAVIGAGVAGVLAVPLVLVLAVAGVTSSLAQTAAGGAAVSSAQCVPAGTGTVGAVDAEQTGNAVSILAVVKGADALGDEVARKRAGVIALAVALQESSLRNLAGGDRDSVGLYQQRPSQGWGTPDQLQDVSYATTSFLGVNPQVTNPGLIDVEDWQTGELAVVAQAVQRSADGALYATREATAQSLVDELWATTTPSVVPADPGSGSGVTVVPAATTAGCSSNPSDGYEGGPGAWGGHSNGRIPLTELCGLSWDPGEFLRCDAAAALEQLDVVYMASFGTHITITDSYRDYDAQVAVYEQKPGLAAKPGTSNHGWGLALDLAGGINSWSTPERDWFVANAPSAGWVSPSWAQPGAGREEPWHWEYIGGAAS